MNERPIGVQEASGLAHVEDDRFLVVDDEKGIYLCRPDEPPVSLEAGSGLADLEGICFDANKDHAYVLAERDGSVWKHKHDDGALDGGARLGKLGNLNKRKNQGWEGIYFAAAGTFADRDELVAVHQTKARVVGFFDAETLSARVLFDLPKKARKLLGDLNDVAVHPTTKHIFVVSGKAGRLGELAVVDGKLELVRVYPLDTGKRDVPEGITFTSDGRLFVCTDGEGMLREIALNA